MRNGSSFSLPLPLPLFQMSIDINVYLTSIRFLFNYYFSLGIISFDATLMRNFLIKANVFSKPTNSNTFLNYNLNPSYRVFTQNLIDSPILRFEKGWFATKKKCCKSVRFVLFSAKVLYHTIRVHFGLSGLRMVISIWWISNVHRKCNI